MLRRPLVLIAALLAAAPLAAQDSRPSSGGMVICYPNAPGNQRVAKPVMERLGQYLSRKLDAPLRPAYFNEVSPAEAWIETARPSYGILSLSVYLRWREQHGLKVVAFSERLGQPTDRYHLLVTTGSPLQTLADLAAKGGTVWSSHLDDRRFAANVVFDGKLPLKDVKLQTTRQPLRALRRMKSGKPFEEKPVDAVLVDGTTWSGLKKLKTFKGVLRVLYASPVLPSPPVVRFGGASEQGGTKLAEVLTDMRKDDEGQRILKTLQTTGFRPADPKAVEAAVAAYGKELPE